MLSANEIQAHELFRDDACVRLNQTAESSIMNMIKWVSVAADRAVRTIRETHQVNTALRARSANTARNTLLKRFPTAKLLMPFT